MWVLFFKKSEKFFQKGTKEQFIHHEISLVSNLFLVFLVILEIYFQSNNIKTPTFIHRTELIFGILFLFEWILHIVHVYIPNKVFWKPSLVLNFIVILSLIAPMLFGNLAILRLIRSIKIIKIYKYNKKLKKDIKRNPDFELRTVKIIKGGAKVAKKIGRKTNPLIDTSKEKWF